MAYDLYKDEINNEGDSQRIEKDLSVFEGEISEIINKRILALDEFALTTKECESLKLFFAIMAFRSKHAVKQFEGMVGTNREFYEKYQPDGNMAHFWKRNLGALAKCRTIDDVLNNQVIDDPIKLFMFRDTQGLAGIYPVVIERRGEEDFVLGDVYPVNLRGELEGVISLDMFSMYPLSPKRMLLLALNGVKGARQEVRILDEGTLRKPAFINDETMRIKVKKVYVQIVRELNEMALKESPTGVVMIDSSRVTLNI